MRTRAWPSWPSVITLVALARTAGAAGPFDNAITPDLIDQRATAVWADGHETPRTDFLDTYNKTHWPNQVTWFVVTAGGRLGGSGIPFGPSVTNGPRHLRVGLAAPITAGSILTRGTVDSVAVLRADAAYPGDLGDDAQWIEATHQSGVELALWVLPAATSTRALRLSVKRPDPANHGAERVLGVAVIPARVANVAPEALPLASSHEATAARIVDGGYNQYDAWSSDDSTRGEPLSAAHPEWVMLLWDHAVSLRGLCAIWPGFGKAEVQTYVGPDGLHPREAPEAEWRTLATPTLAHHHPQTLVPNWIDFGRTISTRALRLRFVAPADESGHYLKGRTSDGKRGWLGELLALTSLGDAPVPPLGSAARADVPHPPIAVPFTMPAPGYATLVVEDAQGRRVRNLVADTWFDAGPQTAWWDGLDESGHLDGPYAGIYTTVGAPVAAGTYGVRGLFHGPLALSYELSIYSPGTPPWLTGPNGETGAGGWLADHTNPSAALFLPGARPRMLLASPVAEAGHAVIWTDLAGRKLEGRRWLGGAWTGASHLARDDGPRAVAGVYAYAGVAWQNRLRLTALHDDGTFMPVGADTSEEAPAPLAGLAVSNGVIVAAISKTDRLAFVDAATGHALGHAPLADGRGLAVDGAGRLLALSGRRLLAFPRTEPALGAPRVVVASGLDDPRALTTDAANDIYVADWGTHQVKVFDADGRPLRTIGRPGGAVVGPYDPLRMHRPAGLAIASDGHLWVAEDSATPKRVSVWTTDGAFVTAFYGPPQYGGGGDLDPRDPTRFYYAGADQNAGLEFALDWKTGTSKLRSIYWLGPTGPDAPPGTTGPETPLYVGDRQYMTDVYNSHPIGGPYFGGLWAMRAGRAVRIASFGLAGGWELLKRAPFRARWPAGVDPLKTTVSVFYIWSDLDGDGRASPDEVTMTRDRVGSLTINERLEICTASAIVYAPTGFTAAGVPRYDAAHGRAQAGDFYLKSVLSGSGQVRALREGWTFSSGAPVRGFRGGAEVWTYPNEWPGQQAGVWSTPPTHAGELMATARLLPQTITPPAGDAGELVALNGDKGDVFLMTADGLFVSTLFRDTRLAPTVWSMPSATRGLRLDDVSLHEEAFWTGLTQTADGTVYVVAGQHHSSLVRVDGLATTRRLGAAPVTVTPALVARAREYAAFAEHERQRRVGRGLMTVPIGAGPIVVDGDLSEWRDASWVVVDEGAGYAEHVRGRVEAAAAVSGKRLYLAFRSTDDRVLNNSGESAPMLFATGGALDLMLATDGAADPRRERAAAGDLRLVVTRVAGQPRAMLYRPTAPGAGRRPVAFSSPSRTVTFDEVVDITKAVELAQRKGDYEVSVPLATLGLAPRDGLELRGDIGILRGDGARTLQRLYWQNKATSSVSDIPTEATLTPQLWGRLRFVAAPRAARP